MKTVKMNKTVTALAIAAVALATISPAAQAGVKKYDFPGVQQRVVDAQGAPVAGLKLDFEIKVRERKFWGWALFPPVEWLACGLGQALGGVIGGWFGGPHAPPKSCWQIWAEDIGLHPIEEVKEWDYPTTNADGLAQYAPRRVYIEGAAFSYMPGLVIQARELDIPFEYSSPATPTTQFTCTKSFAQPTCAVAIPGKKRIAEAAETGLTCTIPLTTDELAALRESAVATCRDRVAQAEKTYGGSYPAMFGHTVSADDARP